MSNAPVHSPTGREGGWMLISPMLSRTEQLMPWSSHRQPTRVWTSSFGLRGRERPSFCKCPSNPTWNELQPVRTQSRIRMCRSYSVSGGVLTKRAWPLGGRLWRVPLVARERLNLQPRPLALSIRRHSEPSFPADTTDSIRAPRTSWSVQSDVKPLNRSQDSGLE